MHESHAVIAGLTLLFLFVISIRRLLLSQHGWRSFTVPDRKGLAGDEIYNVEHYSEGTATVSLKYTGENVLRFTLEAPFVYAGPFAAVLQEPFQALAELGGDYLDAGYYADWIAVEVPYNSPAMRSHMPDAFFWKVASELARVKAILQDYRPAESGTIGSEPAETSLPSSIPSLSVSGSRGLAPSTSSSPSGRLSLSLSEE